MNRKILALLIILLATVSVATVFAGEQLVSHDFGKFTMDIPDGAAISESKGSVNQQIYNITNKDGSLFGSVVYYDTSNTNGNNNTTDFVLNTAYKDFKNKTTNGNITSMPSGNGIDNIYCVSSNDNSKVVVVIVGDTRVQQMLNSIKFK